MYLKNYTETDPVFAANRTSIWDAISDKLDATNQRYNDTEAIATKLDITDQRYNESAAVVTKLSITDQRYNETNWASQTFYSKSGNINATGYNITAKYYSNDGSQGITNTTGYKVCKAASGKNCDAWCTLQIKNGLITGCV
jgi:hypothetical protein